MRLLNFLSVVLFASTINPAIAASSVESSVVVAATPQQIILCIHNQQANSRRVLSSGNGKSLVEETFKGMPVIGDADCVYEEETDGSLNVSYKLVRSEKLKKFSGDWKLTPMANNMTRVTLTSIVDAGLHMPFADRVTTGVAKKMIARRLNALKQSAQSTDNKIALAN